MAKSSPPASLTRRTFLSRSAMTIGVMAGAGALLDACNAVSSNGTVTLTVMGQEFARDTKLIDAFQAINPKIKVIGLKDDPVKLSALIAAGTPPDLVRAQGAIDTPFYAARGLMQPLDSFIAKSSIIKESDLAAINDVWRWDGTTQGSGPRYGLAQDWSQDNMFWFNKAVFDAAKQPYPSTTTPLNYDQWLDLAKKLAVREGGKLKVYGLDAETDFTLGQRVITMILSQGRQLYNSDFTKADFTTAEARKALQWFVDYAQAHVGPSPLDPNPDGWSWPPFAANRLGMANYGYWMGGQIPSQPSVGDVAGLAPAPQFGSQRISPCFAATGYWIPKNSKHHDVAFQLLEWYFGTFKKQDTTTGGGIPSLKSYTSLQPQSQPYQHEAFQVQQAELPYLTVLHNSPYISGNALDITILQNLTPVFSGQVSLDAAVGQMNSSVNLLLQQGKELIG